MNKNNKFAVLSLSGGMDSSTLLLRLLSEGYNVTALSFDYGQKHKVELERATELVEYLNRHNMSVKHQIIELEGLSTLLNSTLVEGGNEVPEGHYKEENMKETVVPNRNKIFSSIIQAVALSIANENKTECIIALGVHSGDHSIYPDCTEAFRNADEYAFKIGNWSSELVNYYTPYMEGDKFSILQDGEKCCTQLGLDFNEIYKRTNTSYKPIWIPFPESTSRVEEVHRTKFGEWYSDYKSASSVERIEAFIKLGRPDLVSYADETGPVEWETVLKHVKSILNPY
jgi:7-cyano-7-deazaguanine synthase